MNIQCVNSEEIVFTDVHITNHNVLKSLKQWQDLKDTQQSNGISLSFVEILNLFLARNHAIIIKKDCTRIEERLRRLTSEVIDISASLSVGYANSREFPLCKVLDT